MRLPYVLLAAVFVPAAAWAGDPDPPSTALDVQAAATERKPAPKHQEHGGFEARIGRDGKVTFRDKLLHVEEAGIGCIGCDGVDAKGHKIGVTTGFPIGASLRFSDVLDVSLRARHRQPYHDEEAKFLDETQDARMDLAASARREDLHDSLRALRETLRQIWTEQGLTAAERRRALFQLWDECAESGDAEVVATARAARATIIAFIRRELPAGTARAFTPRELKELNAGRESRQPFAPYEP